MATWRCRVDSPLGPLLLTFSDQGLTHLQFAHEAKEGQPPPADKAPQPWMAEVVAALRAYLAGKPIDPRSLRLAPAGTPFQLRVWRELLAIPPGHTVSYRELARRAGRPKAGRAVGQACGANPIPILIPCHRVIRADGSLGGFSSGLAHKRWLLDLEG